MIKKRDNNTPALDMMFMVALTFLLLVIMMVPFLNPIAKQGDIETPNKLIAEIEWDKTSNKDIDIHVRGPGGQRIYYAFKDGGYLSLERDDLGSTSDTFVVNGVETTVKRNYEVVSFHELPSGEYVFNVHYFSTKGDPIEVTLKVTMVTPFSVVYEGTIVLTPRQEATAVTFVISPDGKVTDIRTDIAIPLRNRGVGP